MNKILRILFLIFFCLFSETAFCTDHLSQKYLASHSDFEIDFLSSLVELTEFDGLSEQQVYYLEENFESYVQKIYGSMDRAYNLLAYSVDEYAWRLNDLIKLIKIDLINLDESHS